MKRLLGVLFALVLVFSLAAIGLPSSILAQSSEVWVDDDWAGANLTDMVPVQSWDSIRLAKEAAVSEGIINIDFTVTDAVLSEDGEYLYLSSKSDYKLYIVNLTDGSIDDISFDKMPESLTIIPQGDAIYLALLTREHDRYWFGEQEGYVAEIDADTRSLVREFWINEDPYDIVATSDGCLYVAPGSGQWDTIKGYDLATTAQVGSTSIRHLSHIRLHPAENYIYAADTDCAPSDIEKFGISAGSIQGLYDSPYHGDYPMCGDLEISPDGTKIFTRCGHVFLSTEDQATDMTHIGTLGKEWNSLTFHETNNIYTVDDTLVRKWHYDTYEQIWAKSINGNGRFVFYEDGYLIVITEGGDYPTKSSIQIIDAATPPAPQAWFVDASATGAGDGTSWVDAYILIQSALGSAAWGDEVWVAAGTFSEAISMKEGVHLYGGFSGTETQRDQRDWVSNVTIIDGSRARGGNHAYHVVIGADNATLDGFTITGGNASGGGETAGGGMYNNNSSPIVTNCIFFNNVAYNDGGGMYNNGSSSVVTNCTFSHNRAAWETGGGMYNSNSSPTVTNCIFSNNLAGFHGGGMSNYSSSPVVTNCIFSSNEVSSWYGGGMYNNNSSPSVTNCTFFNNSAGSGGDGIYNYNSSPSVTNCILWDNGEEISNDATSIPLVTYCDVQGGYFGEGNIDADPLFVDPENGDYHLQAVSPCIDAGTDTGAPSEDIEGNVRPIDGNGDSVAVTDMGAYEYVPSIEPAIDATIVFNPNTLNLGSKGKWVTTYIELQEGYDVNDIDVGTILLNDSVSAELKPVAVGDHDGDGVPDLMVKFNRASVQGILTAGDEIEVTVSGELIDGAFFEGADTIRVIAKGKK